MTEEVNDIQLNEKSDAVNSENNDIENNNSENNDSVTCTSSQTGSSSSSLSRMSDYNEFVTNTMAFDDIASIIISHLLRDTDVLNYRVATGMKNINQEKSRILMKQQPHDRCRDSNRSTLSLHASLQIHSASNTFSFAKFFATLYVDVMDAYEEIIHEQTLQLISSAPRYVIYSDTTKEHILNETQKYRFMYDESYSAVTTMGVKSCHPQRRLCATTTTTTLHDAYGDKTTFCNASAWFTPHTFNYMQSLKRLRIPVWFPETMNACKSSKDGNQYNFKICIDYNHPYRQKIYDHPKFLPTCVHDTYNDITFTWDLSHSQQLYQKGVFYDELYSASKSRLEYKPMPYRLDNPHKLMITRNLIEVDQHKKSTYTCNWYNETFHVSWTIPYTVDDLEQGSTRDQDYQKACTLTIRLFSIHWFCGKDKYTTFNRAGIAKNNAVIGSLRPYKITIQYGALTLHWADRVISSNHGITHSLDRITFDNTGGILEEIYVFQGKVPYIEPHYFPRDQVHLSSSYSLFPWFCDVYERMDIFSCGLAPHTVSICNRDYAVMIHFCHMSEAVNSHQDDDDSTTTTTQQHQQHCHLFVDPNHTSDRHQANDFKMNFDQTRKYPAYFQLVPI
jgi:hypothetical protein